MWERIPVAQIGGNMAINGLNAGTGFQTTQAAASYESVTVTAEVTKVSVGISESDAVVYSKSSDEAVPAKENKIDYDTIEKLKADADERNAQLKGLVEKMLLKQAGTFSNSEGLASIFRRLEVDEETRAKAQEDISEDGYWGIEQTSDRILDFAKALAGNDPDAAQSMLEAVKEGFKQAGIEWGEELPDISKETMKTTLEKLNAWIDSLKEGLNGSASGSYAYMNSTTVKVSATYTKAEYSESQTLITDSAPVQTEQLTEEKE